MPKINVPMVSAQYYNPQEQADGLAVVNSVIKTYGKTIEMFCKLMGIDETVVYSFIRVESAGDPWAATGRNGRKSSPAVGLMQIDEGTATIAVFLANKIGLLGSEQKNILIKMLGSQKVACILTMKNQSLPTRCKALITRKQLIDSVELNLFCGILFLAVLQKKYTENGIIRLDKMIVAYNRGFNVESKVFSMANLSPQQVYDGVVRSKMEKSKAVITQNYIAKIVGKTGILTNLINPNYV